VYDSIIGHSFELFTILLVCVPPSECWKGFSIHLFDLQIERKRREHTIKAYYRRLTLKDSFFKVAVIKIQFKKITFLKLIAKNFILTSVIEVYIMKKQLFCDGPCLCIDPLDSLTRHEYKIPCLA